MRHAVCVDRTKPPADIRRALRVEVGFGCPVDGCGSPYLTWHHFDPPWRERQHHDAAGMIALCLQHHKEADSGAFSHEQLRVLKASPFRSRRARVVSSWLVVGVPGLRGVSCLHPTRLPDARMRCRDVPARQPHRHGRWTAERPPSDSSITAYRQEARLIRVRREHRSPFGLWSTSPAGLPGQGLEIPAGVCSDRPPR